MISNEYISEDWKKKTALFIASQTMSIFGSSLVQFAIIWYITLTTKSGTILTISTLFAFLPQLVISLFAGVWADRFNRKKIIILSDLLTAFSTLVLAMFFAFGYESLWLVFFVSGLRSVGAGIQMPSVNALLPQLVPVEKLIKVNGINNSIYPVIMLVAPAVSGAMMSYASLENIFYIDVVTAAIAIILMLFLKVPPLPRKVEELEAGYLSDLKEGLVYIKSHRGIKIFFIFFAIFFILIVPAALLTPLLVARSFGDEVWKLTANEILFSTGAILGGIMMTAWGGFKDRIKTIGAGCILNGILFGLLGVADTFIIYLGIIFLSGLPSAMIHVPATTFLQEVVDMEVQGRIFGVFQIIITSAMPIGMLVFGPIADIITIELLLIITGFLLVVPGTLILFNKSLSEERKIMSNH